jgi:PKD repeat protein
MKQLIKTCLFIFIANSCFAQNTNLSGIINKYAAVSAIDTCRAMLTVSDTAGFRKGNWLILIQMKGASIESANNTSFGNITNMNQAGKYERAIIDSVSANRLFLRSKILNPYEPSFGLVQVVSFPIYTNATVTGRVISKRWNGTTGGVVALEVTGTLTMDAEISADTSGFRGGASFVASSNDCYFLFTQNNFSYDASNWRGAPKGEGIAAIIGGKESGKGAQANGGGGGNDHNSGGGGGANISNGGIGGNNAEPSAAGCKGNHPGIGGKKISITSNRIFMGGGGGAGHTNNDFLSTGGTGGGIVIVLAGSINGTTPWFTAQGGNAALAPSDGGGGGGAGGTVICSVANMPNNLAVGVQGGNGGNTGSVGVNRCLGPGGGGSGGRTITNFSLSVAPGGEAGVVKFTTEACIGSNNGASIGQNSVTEVFESIPESQNIIGNPVIVQQPVAQSVCTDENFSFTCQSGLTNANYQWQYFIGGFWVNIPIGASYVGVNTPNLSFSSANLSQNGLKFRCKAEKLPCFTLTSQEATLTVKQGAVCDFTFTSTQNQFVFTNQSQNATGYFWDFGDGFSSTLANPTHTYAMDGDYTVTLFAIANCDTATQVQQISIFPAPIPNIEYQGELISCGPTTISFSTAIIGQADNFKWYFPNGNPATSLDSFVTVTYTQSGSYVATLEASNSVGSNITSIPLEVEIYEIPEANFEFDAAIGGLVQFLDLSTGATSTNWFFGDGGSSQMLNPSHQYTENGTYVVTLQVTNPCGAAVFQQFVNVIVVGTVLISDNKYLLAYPNPMEDVLWVESNLPDAGTYKLIDINGKTIITTQKSIAQKQQIDVSHLAAGVYFLILETEKGKYMVKMVR